MPDQIKYAHHELDPVLMQGHEALIFINGHWQGMCHALAFEAKLMSKDDFYRIFGMGPLKGLSDCYFDPR